MLALKLVATPQAPSPAHPALIVAPDSQASVASWPGAGEEVESLKLIPPEIITDADRAALIARAESGEHCYAYWVREDETSVHFIRWFLYLEKHAYSFCGIVNGRTIIYKVGP